MRTALHRYLELSDDVRNEAVFEELISLFAPDAQVNVHNQPVEGIEAIREFYRNFIGGIAESRHLWHFTHEEKESATATVGMVFRTLDGNVMTALGTEVAHFDTDGRITRLTATS